jgi:choline dehydrogenase-like flavoprotein
VVLVCLPVALHSVSPWRTRTMVTGREPTPPGSTAGLRSRYRRRVPGSLTSPERRLRGLLIAHAIWSAVLACGYIASGDTGIFAFIANSFAKDMLFVALSVLGAADVRRFGWTALVIAGGYVALVIGETATLIWGGAPAQDVLGVDVSATVVLFGWMAIDLVLTVWFAAWWAAAVRARHGLRYLHPLAFLGLVALAEVMIEGRREVLSPEQIAKNVDRYLATLNARGKARVQLALVALTVWPVLTLRPPLPALSPSTRKRFLEKRFIEDVAARRVFQPLRPIVQVIIRTGAQMSYLGYYGDRRSWPSIGYTPYQDRHPDGRAAAPSDPPAPPLRCLAAPPRARYETLVIGSGAAGSILALRFAQAGRRVLVLERGPHVDPRDFTDDEVDQYLRLYNEGALQLATNFSLQVLQGMCVGGGTTINNALCLPPPRPVLEDWAQRGVDPAALEAGIAEIRSLLEVTPIREATTTPAARRFAKAVRELGLPGELELMEANITAACRGTGYCNIGCAYGAKRAALDALLPLAQAEHGLELMADVEVVQILTDGDRAVGVVGRHGPSGERFSIAADEVVVAAGPIGSSWLLQRSGLGGDRVGEGLHFNINSPLTADFPDPVDAFAGIQMSHAYVAPGAPPDYLVETWFNPPATQALAMPGWFDRHFHNMDRYRHMACAGVLVGTTTPGRVKPTWEGPEIEYTASKADRDRLVEGLRMAGRIWLHAGAERVMPTTFAWQEYRTAASLDGLAPSIRETGDLLMTSAHPQGGNAIGDVVDEDFLVRGFANLWLCDASVFPSSVHVNPQLTVMGMAQYAAHRILGHDLPAGT